MKILVLSWGDFERWKEIRYRFGDETSVGPSTLPILQKAIKPDWTVIVLPDTLGRDFESLEALREDVRNRLMGFLDRIGAGREVDAIIVPGIGEFPHGTFRGGAMDTYHYTLYRLAQVLPIEGPLEVHFDSTHGLNYITLLTYRALKELLGIAAMTNRVTFTAYNSDPFVPGITRELTINVIEKSEVKQSPLNEALPSSRKGYLGNFALPGREYGSVIKSMEKIGEVTRGAGKLNAWIASVIYGLPLVFGAYYPDGRLLEEALDEVLSAYSENIRVSEKRIERALSLGDGFGVLVKLLYQRKVLKMGGLPKEEFSLEELGEIAERFFKGRIRESTKTELHRLTSSVKVNTNGWIRYSEFLKMMGKNPNPQVDPRNFLAHAGLEANLIEVKREGELYVRYTGEKVLYGGTPAEPEKVITAVLSKAMGVT
ncbi:MAG TPA: TIGR01897 family CRISPR-associated protein [Thermococcus sp.]|nr:TIGR01897 family CRISPR-associated protein [Thermococcus sp.]